MALAVVGGSRREDRSGRSDNDGGRAVDERLSDVQAGNTTRAERVVKRPVHVQAHRREGAIEDLRTPDSDDLAVGWLHDYTGCLLVVVDVDRLDPVAGEGRVELAGGRVANVGEVGRVQGVHREAGEHDRAVGAERNSTCPSAAPEPIGVRTKPSEPKPLSRLPSAFRRRARKSLSPISPSGLDGGPGGERGSGGGGGGCVHPASTILPSGWTTTACASAPSC